MRRRYLIAWIVLALGLIASSAQCSAQNTCSYSFNPPTATLVVDPNNPSGGAVTFTVVASDQSCVYGLLVPRVPDYGPGLLHLQPGTQTYTLTNEYTPTQGCCTDQANVIVGSFGPEYFRNAPVFSGSIAILPVTDPGYTTSSLRSTTFTVPDSVNGQPYAPFQLQASGGTPPYTWQCHDCSAPSVTPLVIDGAGNVTRSTSFVDPVPPYLTQMYPLLFTIDLDLIDAAGTDVSFVISFKNYPSSAELCTNAGYGGDADGDGLCDDWETKGILDPNGNILVNLPAMGANPMHKDIFVQADYMVSSGGLGLFGHNHQPTAEAIGLVTTSFANAPVQNPDGNTGIMLHVDCGSTCIMNPVTGQNWGLLSQAHTIPETGNEVLGSFDALKNYQWAAFDKLRATDSPSFSTGGRQQAFHYVVFAHDMPRYPDPTVGDVLGLSRDIPQSDFIVALGSTGIMDNYVGQPLDQAITFMHELGHNLSLTHGGSMPDAKINKKPNYLSIMNYLFHTSGLIINSTFGHLDYSRFQLPTLNEALLNENVGLGNDSLVASYGMEYQCDPRTATTPTTVVPPLLRARGPIDWNCNGRYDSGTVAASINGDPTNAQLQNYSVLNGYNDWLYLVYNGGALAGLSVDYTAPALSPPGQEPPFVKDGVPFEPHVASPGVTQLNPGSSIALTFTITNNGTEADTYTLIPSSSYAWADLSVVPPSIQLGSKASTQITLLATVPTNAISGTIDSFSIEAVSQGSPNLVGAGVAEITVAPATMVAATPVFGPAASTFTSPQTVTITDATSGAVIYYTIDGTTPTTSSKLYSGPISVVSTETIQAIAVASGYSNSTVASATYTISIPVAASPTFSPTAGTFTTAQMVTISDATSGAAVYYTINGTAPTTSSALYIGPITVSSTETLEAIAVASGYSSSPVSSVTYAINIPTSAAPTFSPVTGTFTAAQTVSIFTTTAGAAIYYTTNGTTPTSSSTLYSRPITVSSTETIQAIALGGGYSNSAVASATYTINLPQDFTFGLSASSLTVTAGQSGTLTASIGPVNGFNQPVSFTCSGLPAGAACSFSPATITPNGTGSSTTTVTITTAARAGLLTGHRPFELAGLMAGLSLWFAGRRFRKLRRMGILLFVMIGAGSLVSCGKSPATQKPTTSTVSINAASGSLSHASTFSLTVQ